MIKFDSITVTEFGTNCYLIWNDQKSCIILDPGGDSDLIIERIEELNLVPKMIINTHGHVDHIGADKVLADKYNIPVYIHPEDQEMLSDNNLNMSNFTGIDYDEPGNIKELKSGDVILLGEEKFLVHHTPGHTKGGIILESGNYLFTGDTIFRESIGRTDFHGGSFDEIENSIKNVIYAFPDNYKIFPGHGEPTDVGYEKKYNPFVKNK